MIPLHKNDFGVLETSVVKDIRYNIENYRVAIRIPKENMRLRIVEDYSGLVADELVAELEYFILSHEKEVSHKVPLTWWDHLKLDHAPEWFLDRYPVKYRHIRFTSKEVFPHSKRAFTKDDIGRGYVTYRYIEPMDFKL